MYTKLPHYKTSICTTFGWQITYKYSQVWPYNTSSHPVPVKLRIDFKILLLTFKALHNKAPEYISNLITVYESRCNLRSLAHYNLLLVEPKPRLVSYGDRAFCKAAPKLWNRLPRDIRHNKSINSFKCSPKTHLIKTAFNL